MAPSSTSDPLKKEFISCAQLSIGGMQQAIKRKHLKALDHDVYCLSETHVQKHLESAETHQFADYFCIWGQNVDNRHFGRVGILAKRSKICDARPLTWEVEHPCNRFYQDGRLVACQVWLGRGGVTITIYSVYGISGARWDRSKKQYFHDLMSAIQTDRIERGPLPSLLMGDFNLEIADSHCIRDSLYSKFWYDMRDRASADVQSQPTCHKGNGPQIDYLFATTDLYDLCTNF